MPDRMDVIGEALEEGGEEEGEHRKGETQRQTDSGGDTDANQGVEAEGSATASSSKDALDNRTEATEADSEPDTAELKDLGPAFPYADVDQGPMYARPETWEALDDALELEAEGQLRDYGIRDATKRELHDAAMRVAADHVDQVVRKVIEARRSAVTKTQ